MSMVLRRAQIVRQTTGEPLFPPLDLSIAPGEIVTIMGPSGCGKSTLLSWISGWLSPDFRACGDVCLGGESLLNLPPEQRQLGLLLQDPLLFPHLSVGGNLAFGLPADIKGRAVRAQRVRETLTEAGLEGFEHRHPDTLSGGQKARVALMRTLLSRPAAVLLDEPFSKLDEALRDRVRHFVFEHVRRHRLPTLLVTHDPADAAHAAQTHPHPEQAVIRLGQPLEKTT